MGKEQLNETRLQEKGWDANIGSHAYKVIARFWRPPMWESFDQIQNREMHLKEYANFVIGKLCQDLNLVLGGKWNFSLD